MKQANDKNNYMPNIFVQIQLFDITITTYAKLAI